MSLSRIVLEERNDMTRRLIGPKRLTRRDTLYWYLIWKRFNSPLH